MNQILLKVARMYVAIGALLITPVVLFGLGEAIAIVAIVIGTPVAMWYISRSAPKIARLYVGSRR